VNGLKVLLQFLITAIKKALKNTIHYNIKIAVDGSLYKLELCTKLYDVTTESSAVITI
jgi:hypothetical protein